MNHPASNASSEAVPFEAVAIVGMAGRFPKARSVEELWQRLQAGEELVSFFTDEELLESGIPPEVFNRPDYVRARAILEEAEAFDAAFFGFNPREAEVMDPQQRVFLEVAWEALENAGCDPDRFDGPIGVYAGLSMNSYLLNNLMGSPEVMEAAGGYQVMISNDKDFLATRVSYKLNLRGPSVDVQTACSTSLVAVQMACQALLSGAADLALAGGVSISSPRKCGYLYVPGMIMSPDGHCRAFDASSQGIVAGEGAGVVVLKRLSEALRDGDTIHAVIRGSAINNDGALKVGYTAPSVNGQAEVIALAQAAAGVNPETITYVEAHGTGTELGDPIEISALTQAFRLGTEKRGYCAVGSVKTNLGHLDAAAGVTGLIKTVLALKNRRIPPSLHFTRPNPNIDFESTPFYVNTRLAEWENGGGPLRAGVSSFGIGGTNAHVVLEEAPPPAPSTPSRSRQLVLLSAKSAAALEAATGRLAASLSEHPEYELADVAFTLQQGRRAFGHRRALVCASREEALSILQSRDPRRLLSASGASEGRPVAFLFTGQGAQYLHMGAELYRDEPVFRQALDTCAEILRPHLGFDLLEALYPQAGGTEEAAARLTRTSLAQPALFAVEYALARLWLSWGLQPQAMLGHSLGEYVAACLAGVFSLEDALALVAARGRLMQSMPAGAMLSLPLPEREVLPLLGPQLSLAAVNGPALCVVSGPEEAVAALQEQLAARGVEGRRLHTSHAFHSPMMDPVLEPFKALFAGLRLNAPSLPFVSNLTGEWITPEQAVDPAYWAAHLRSTVRFSQGLETLFREPGLALLEIGPGRTLATLARSHPARPQEQPVFTSLRHPLDQVSDLTFLLQTLGQLWLSGVQVDWDGFYAGEKRRRLPLPAYPFERKRYWVEPKKQPLAAETRPSGRLERNPDLTRWFFTPSWKRQVLGPANGRAEAASGWLVFCDASGVGEKLARSLEARGQSVVRVQRGAAFASPAAGVFTLDPAREEDYRALVAALQEQGRLPGRVLHCWTLDRPEASTDPLDYIERAQELGYYSLVALTAALNEKLGDAPYRLDVLSSGTQDVIGLEELDPSRATVLGFCRAIPLIHSPLDCRHIDLHLPDLHGLPETVWLQNLLAELEASSPEEFVAYRGDYRWVQAFEPAKFDPETPLELREGGVYLITGGLGGLGLLLADFLARQTRCSLALLSRSPLPERDRWEEWLAAHDDADRTSRRIRQLMELEQQGARVLPLAADVTDYGQMKAAVTQIRAELGPITGVIHAAGLTEADPAADKTAASIVPILRPKTLGTAILDSLLEGEALDFFVLFSSISTVVGGSGHAYVAANAYLDAFAQYTRRSGRRVIAINWDLWQEVGMYRDTEVAEHLRSWKEQTLAKGIASREGLEAFRMILARPLNQVIVSTHDLVRMREWIQFLHGGEALPDQNRPPAAEDPGLQVHGLHERPNLGNAYVAPESETEKRLAGIWQQILGMESIGLHDNFFELGGHSLMATQIISRVQVAYEVEIPVRAIFEAPTLVELAERVDTLLWAKGGGRSAGEDALEEREELEF